MSSGIPEFRPFGQKGKFSAFGLWFRSPKLKAEYGRNSRKALDFLLFVHENIAHVNYQWYLFKCELSLQFEYKHYFKD